MGSASAAAFAIRGAHLQHVANDLIVPSSVVGDATIHYENGGWRYAINAVNVTDKVYVTSCSSEIACYYAERLRVTGSIAYKW